MPRIKCKTVYSYKELSDSAKETARSEIQEHMTGDFDWFEQVYEDADTIAGLMGIELDRRNKKTEGPAIFFSGFSSQGDGACFEGRYEYKPGSVKAIKEHAPKDEELHAIAKRLADAQRKAFYQITATVKQSGHYYHEYAMDIQIVRKDYRGSNTSVFHNTAEGLRDFARWIYKRLEAEYNYNGSEEYCSETAESNDWEFNEDGTFSD